MSYTLSSDIYVIFLNYLIFLITVAQGSNDVYSMYSMKKSH